MSQDSQYLHKSHNVTVLLYHIVSSAKYRRVVFTKDVGKVLVEVCEEIEKRYDRDWYRSRSCSFFSSKCTFL